jgi:hypothetical protein
MVNEFDKIPDPSDDEMYLLTAEEFLESAGKDATDEERKANVARLDLEHEIQAQTELIDDLVDQYSRTHDESVADAIEAAKIDLGRMLVDRLNLPPA